MNVAAIRTATASATDVGRRRSHNEDRHAVWASDDDALGSPEVMLVVCDGMGGSNAGDVASRIAVETVVRVFTARRDGGTLDALTAAVREANREVWEHSRTREDLHGMGTTCTAIAIAGTELSVAHVGDSRAYLVRDGEVRQLTQDHSLVAQLVASGQLRPEDARSDPRRNVVTRSVGGGPNLEVDTLKLEERLRPGDTVLVCSDGLHGQVSEGDLGRIAAQASLERVCEDLVALANQRGGPDNITVAVARPGVPERRPTRPTPRPAGADVVAARRTLQLLIAALFALMLVLCGLAWVVLGMIRAERDGSVTTKVAGSRSSGGHGAWR